MAVFGVITWSLFVDGLRLVSICAFLACSLTFNIYSFAALISVLISLYLLDRNQYKEPAPLPSFPSKNPYKGTRKLEDEETIPAEVKKQYVDKILNLVLYDTEDCQALRNFEPIISSTHCIFAKKSVIWGARDYDRKLTIEQNVERSLPTLIKFLTVGSVLHLDGFVFELPGEEFGQDVHQFGEGVRRVLKCISDHDPLGFHCMNRTYMSKIGWSFEFGGVPIFVTTFAPCYPENHSRYAFGADNAFILLQPMYSFAIHDIGEDTAKTNWDHPVTIRDKIRVAYKENDRGYYIRDTIIYPAAHDIVKPLKEGTGEIIEWWKDPNSPPEELRGDEDDEPSDLDEEEELGEEEEAELKEEGEGSGYESDQEEELTVDPVAKKEQ